MIINKQKWFLFIIIYLILVFVYIVINFFVVSLSTSYLSWLFILSLITFISFNFFKENIIKQNYIREINSEIPFFLSNFANDLEKNISLKLALENRVDNSLIGKKIKSALNKVDKKGYSLQNALISVSSDHKELERVFYQINDIINIGSKNKADALRTFADSLIEKQNYKIKNYSTKLNLISLIFIVISAVLPAMFFMFLLVGSNFLEISFTPLSVVIITVIAFPIIDMFILLFMKYNLP